MAAEPLVGFAPSFPKTEGAVRLCREALLPPVSEIAGLVKNKPDAIEEGLHSLDCDLFIPAVGEIDLVAVSKGRLVLVSVFGELTSDHLGRAAGIGQWAHENATVLKRVYLGNSQTEFSPRILFLCSGLDDRALLLMKMIANLPLEIYRYRCLESGGNRWLAIEKTVPLRDPSRHCEPDVRRGKQSHDIVNDLFKGAKIELTDEEINEFFDSANFPGPYFNTSAV